MPCRKRRPERSSVSACGPDAFQNPLETQRQQALATALKQLHKGVSAEEVLEKLSLQLTNKLLHAPTVALQKINQQPELSDAVSSIYRLPEHL